MTKISILRGPMSNNVAILGISDYGLIIKIIKKGGIGVMPTDTLYGLVGSALDKKVVERIYQVRKRELNKPFIILISSLKDLDIFGIRLNTRTTDLLKKLWPGPISIILSCKNKKLVYLRRGAETLAFRLPKPVWLRKILQKTGPLVAPSANIAGEPPALTIEEARKYFGGNVDFYINRGELDNPPSSLVEIKR